MPEFKRKPLEGIFCLMPLCLKDNQEIDYDAIAWNVDWLSEKGIHGFIQFGCMGQMYAVSESEFNEACDVAVRAAAKSDIAAVVSSTCTNTQEAVRRATYAENAGADGSMLALPYAFPTTRDWAIEFYQTVDRSLNGELAILLYNYPPLTGFNVTPGMWKEDLLKIKSIKAVKDSDMSIAHHDETLIAIGDKVNWFSCYDAPFWHDSMVGANGIVGIMSWVAPRVFVKWYEECRAGHQMDPWTLDVWKLTTNIFGAMMGPDMPPMLSYEGAYLNALVEIGGAKSGPPRKPYAALPASARQALEGMVKPLVDMEKDMG